MRKVKFRIEFYTWSGEDTIYIHAKDQKEAKISAINQYVKETGDNFAKTEGRT